MVISATSLSEVSLMAKVPESECRMPTLMVSAARAGGAPSRAAQRTDDRMEASFQLFMGWLLLGPAGPAPLPARVGPALAPQQPAHFPPFGERCPRGHFRPDRRNASS